MTFSRQMNPIFGFALVAATMLSVALPNHALADDMQTFKMTLENDAFSPKGMKVPANKAFVLRVLNGESVAAEIESHDMNFEKVAPSYTEVILHIKPLKPGRYLMYNEYKQDVANIYITAE